MYNEIKAQKNFVEKCGGIKIDHFDCHHNLCENKIIKEVVEDLAKEFNLPIRKMFESEKVKSPDVLYKDFTISNVNIENLKKVVSKYKNSDKVVEIITHPGWIDEHTKKITSYLGREEEMKVLENALSEKVFEGVELINFSQI